MTSRSRAFGESPEKAVYITRQVLEGIEPLGLISHDLQDEWQFLHDIADDDDAVERDFADLRIVHLYHVVEKFPVVEQFADLPIGWIAWLDDDGESWVREPRPAEWDERE
jgi:hypothetical protein